MAKRENMNGQETKKPFYKTFWFYVIMIPLVLYVIGKYTPEDNKPSRNTNNKSASTQTNDIEQKMREWAGEAGPCRHSCWRECATFPASRRHNSGLRQ